jgi:hypothetical protein
MISVINIPSHGKISHIEQYSNKRSDFSRVDVVSWILMMSDFGTLHLRLDIDIIRYDLKQKWAEK